MTSEETKEIFTFTDYDDDSVETQVYSMTGECGAPQPVVKPHPQYDSCTPISRNIMNGDDSEYLPFLPFSDDGTYNFEFDNVQHKYFAWQKPFIDPDCRRGFMIIQFCI